MNQIEIGSFIAKKRKQRNLTQAELVERLGVSNKTVSKWETGKNMPDYSIIQNLCKELEISISELMDGEDNEPSSIRAYDDNQILDLIQRTQKLESQKNMLYGFVLMIMGIVFLMMHFLVTGSNVKDFISGLLLGLSIVEMIAGLYIVSKHLSKK